MLQRSSRFPWLMVAGLLALASPGWCRQGGQPGQPGQAGDLALLVKRGPGRLVVWAMNRRTGQPVAGAQIHATFPGAPALEARAGRDGLAVLAVPAGPAQSATCVVNATAGEQAASAQIGTFGPAAEPAERLFAWMNAARYAPGEYWQLRGMARAADGSPLANAPIAAKMTDPQGKVVHERSVQSDRYGTFEDSGDLMAGLPFGVYRVTVTDGKQQQALAFGLLPAAGALIDVSIRPPDEGGSVALEARQSLGEPVRRGQVRYWAYPAYRPWTVPGDLAQYPWLAGQPPLQIQYWNPLAQGRARTDDLGRASLRLDLAKITAGQTYLLAAAVTDRYGRSAYASLLVEPAGATAVAAPPPPVRRGRRVPEPAPVPPADPQLVLEPDRAEYSAGGTARLSARCGFDGGWALLTLEGSELYSAHVVQLRKGEQRIEAALVDARMRMVHADLIAFDPAGAPHRATRLLLIQPARGLLRVEAEARPAGPGELDVDVRTADGSGRPTPARCFLDLMRRRAPEAGEAAETEAALARTLATPEVNNVLTQGQPWGLWNADLAPWLRGAGAPAWFASDSPASGSAVTTDRRGHARLRLRYSGSLADLQLALRGASIAGAGAALLPLEGQGPVAVRLHVPSPLFKSDTATARAEIENRTGLLQPVSLRWSGDGIETPGIQPALLPLPPHARFWFDIPLQATRPGRHSLRATVEAGGEHASDVASVAVMDDRMVAAAASPGVSLRRFDAGTGQPAPLAAGANVGPGEEFEVRLTVPVRDGGDLRLIAPVSGGFSVVSIDAPEKVAVQRTEEGLKFLWSEAPRDETASVSYRLRALTPGVLALGRPVLYRGDAVIGAAAPQRIAVVDLAAPRLSFAEVVGGRLQLRYQIGSGFLGEVAGSLAVRLRGGDGTTLADASVPAALDGSGDGTREVVVSLPALDPKRVQETVVEATLRGGGRLALGGASVRLPPLESRGSMRLSLALGEPVTRLLGQSDLIAGAPAALRVIALNSRGQRPLEGAAVKISFRRKDGERTFVLAEGRTDAAGTLNARFVVPEAARGAGLLAVESSSSLGQETVTRGAQVEDRLQMLLSTDKPIYQPGQLIHIRSLTLMKPDLKPLAGAPVTLEVSDPKGNKVFKQRVTSTEFGVAAAEFQLASEINMGSYVLRAIAQPPSGAPLTVEKTLEIKKYVLPKFKIEIATERPYYQPGERLKGTVKVNYFFGKPVAGGAIELKLSTFVTRFEEIAKIEGKTDAQGSFTFEQELPKLFVGQPLNQGNATLLIEAAVTDTASHRETAAHNLTVAANPIQVAVVPESGVLAPKLENRLYVVASYPDGRPAGRARFRLSGAGLTEAGLEGAADEHGIAQVAFTPPAGTTSVRLQADAEDDHGNRAREAITLREGERQDNILLRADRAIYEVGQPAQLEALCTTPKGTVYLDVVRNRQTVLTQTIELHDGRGRITIPLGEDTSGTVEFRAYRILPSGEIARDTRIAYVNPANDLVVKATPEKEIYAPGAPASIAFDVRDRQGHPVMAALGVNIVDESVFALQELQPGLEKVYFTLEKELEQPRYEIHWSSPGMGVFEQSNGAPPSEERQELARVMFAAVEMAHDYSLAANTEQDRRAAARAAGERLRGAVQIALQNGQFNNERDAYFAAHHAYPEEREGLRFFAGENRPLKEADLRDPWGQPWALRFGAPLINQQLPFDLVSAGPDGEIDTDDDVTVEGSFYAWSYLTNAARQWAQVADWGVITDTELAGTSLYFPYGLGDVLYKRSAGRADFRMMNGPMGAAGGGFGGGMGGGGFGGGGAGRGGFGPQFDRLELLAESAPEERNVLALGVDNSAVTKEAQLHHAGNGAGEPAVKPVRVREYFPETLYSNSSLVTDADGRAKIDLRTADSITTWRITALANSRVGQLGSVTAPVRVFQDFFVCFR